MVSSIFVPKATAHARNHRNDSFDLACRQLRFPPSLRGSVAVPGLHGGATWSGASFDPTTSILYVNSNERPNIMERPLRATLSGMVHRVIFSFLTATVTSASNRPRARPLTTLQPGITTIERNPSFQSEHGT